MSVQVDMTMDRKIRSEERLKSQGVPVDTSLPVIEGEEDVRLRRPADVAARIVVLYALQGVIFHDDPKRVVHWIQGEGLWDRLSSEEEPVFQLVLPPFNEGKQQKLQDMVDHPLTWRIEALWALLWALGLIERLGFPDAECDGAKVKEVVPEIETEVTTYINDAKLRPLSEILDELDWLRRLLWVGEQDKTGETLPKGYEAIIAWQWHEALNWLIGNQVWR
ncbi:protein of unknown function [Marininema mesophilum]|uniref:DUF4272 domain-containing protein n=1 Tax=Marininema mesophilum TaxID=1048340 RepID=A0A1H2TSY8_9BACL|nr:DUF4272 domain-containing protein [Marininema mesophilum]SDW46848.1 protein of unknown function [Marininema mesophilum]